jgi:hypothetical protein
MTAAQIQKLYPGNQLARLASSALADDRVADRRAGMSPFFALPYGKAVHSLPEQRTMFEQGIMASQKRKHGYLVGTDMTYSVRGAFNDAGEWVYNYHHIQMAWEGYLVCLSAHGIEVQ